MSRWSEVADYLSLRRMRSLRLLCLCLSVCTVGSAPLLTHNKFFGSSHNLDGARALAQRREAISRGVGGPTGWDNVAGYRAGVV